MSIVKQVLTTYLESQKISADDFDLGRKKSPDFSARLERARNRSRVGFWLCVVMLLTLFLVILSISFLRFNQLINHPGAVTGIFGMSAGGVVILMLQLWRESSRADYLLVMLSELRDLDSTEFLKIVRAVARHWYGVEESLTKRDSRA